jgi:4-alpha-methyl-delta7-sterol-4alpha-methyl oxidase
VVEAVLAQFRDPWFWRFAMGANLVSMVAFAAFAGPMTWLAGKDPAWARRWRIQTRPPREQRLVLPSIRTWLVNNAIMLVVTALAWPILRRTGVHGGALPPAWRIAAEVIAFVYLDDFLFYWMHRALHWGWLYKRIHALHHTILTPWAVTGHYMHPVEYVAIGTLILVGPVLFSSHWVTLYVWVIWRQWEAAEGHSGYDFPWSITNWLPGGDGAAHHDFHHAKVRGNYAGFLRHCDAWFGTYARGYAEHLERKKGSSASRNRTA